jgi:hypothetical protein
LKPFSVESGNCSDGRKGFLTIRQQADAFYWPPFSCFRNFAPPFSVEQVGMEAPACFPTNENAFALLRVARIIFESQMANDAAPKRSTIRTDVYKFGHELTNMVSI